MTTCIFCRIASGEIPANVVYRDDLATAFRDVNPQAPVHVLVVPNAHVPSIAGLGDDDRQLLGHLIGVANEIARREGISTTGYRLTVNHGPDAGQTVDHLHLHVLGGRRLGWPPG